MTSAWSKMYQFSHVLEVGRFRTISLLLVIMFIMPGHSRGQGDWDVSDDAPPSTSSLKPLPEPQLSIDPFRIAVYEQCKPGKGTPPRRTEKVAIQILSEYEGVGFESVSTDSSLLLILRTKNRGRYAQNFRIPDSSFSLRVVLGEDTATLRVDRSGGNLSVTYRDTSPLLIIEEPKVLDDDIVPMQFMSGSTQRMARNFVKSLTSRFGQDVRVEQLPSGFYPCLPVPAIYTARIGRGKSAILINEAEQGYLICSRVLNTGRWEEICDWIYGQQNEEMLRVSTDGGVQYSPSR